MVGQNGEQLSGQEAAARVDAAFMAAQEAINGGDDVAARAALEVLGTLDTAGALTQAQHNRARELTIQYYRENPIITHPKGERRRSIAETAADIWLDQIYAALNNNDREKYTELIKSITGEGKTAPEAGKLTEKQRQRLEGLRKFAEVLFQETNNQVALRQAREYLAEALSGSNSIRDRIQNFVRAHNQIETLEQQQLNTAEQQELQLAQTQRDQLRPVLDTAVATRIDELLQELPQLTLDTADNQMDELADLLALYIDQSIVPILQLQDIPNLQNRVDTAIRDLHERHREEQLGALERQLQELTATITADTYNHGDGITIDGTQHPDFAEATAGWLDEVTALRAVQPPDQLSPDHDGRLTAIQNRLGRAQEFNTILVDLENAARLQQADLEALITTVQQRQQNFATFGTNDPGHEYAAAYQRQLDQATTEYQRRIIDYTQGIVHLLRLAGTMVTQSNYEPTLTVAVTRGNNTQQMAADEVIRLAFNTRAEVLDQYNFLEQQQLNFNPADRQTVELTINRMNELQNIFEVQELIAQLSNDAQAGQLTPQQFAQRQQDIRDAIASNITAPADQNLLTQRVETLRPPEVTAEQFVQQVLQIENDLQNDPNFDVRALNYRYTDPIRGTTFPVTAVAYITAYRRTLTLNTNQNNFVQEVLTALQDRLEQVNKADLTAWQQAIHPRAWWQNANTEATTPVDPNANEAALQNRLTQAERYLQTFNTEVNNLAGTPQDPQANGALVLGHINEARTALQTRIDEVRARIGEVRAENQKKQDEAQKAAAEKAAEQAALATWKTEVKPLTDAIEVIETEVDVAKVKPHSTAADAKDEQELQALKDDVVAKKNKLERDTAALDVDRTQYQAVKTEIVILVGKDTKSGRYGHALELVGNALARSKELKPVEEMSQLEIIREIKSIGFDPILSNYGKEARDDRANRLARRFVQRSGDYATLPDANDRFELLVEQVGYLLELMVGKQDQGKKYATNPREKLTDVLNQYMLSREQIMQAATYHPVWGSEVRAILKETTEIAASNSYRFPDGNTFGYGVLASAQGQKYINEFIQTHFGAKHEKARYFAELLFIGFDFADIVLEQGQRKANGTRNHNQTEKFDPIFMQDPLASFEQNWDRYGANMADWRGWFLVFLKPIPENKLYGAGGKAAPTNQFQELLFKYYDMFFPVDKLIDRQEVAGFCESYFPNAYDMLTLNETPSPNPNDRDEVLDLLGTDKVAGHDGTVTSAKAAPLADWDGYDITAVGWKDMLSLSYTHVGNNLEANDILISYGKDKRGLLNEFLSAAGKAKVFYPKHLRKFLAPMLTLYAARLIVAVKGDLKEKDEVRHKMIIEIKKSMEDDRGLKGFPDEVNKVIHALEHLNVRECGPKIRWRSIGKYVNALYDARHLSKTRVWARFPWETVQNEDAKHYIQYMKREKLPPPPALRNGSMIDKEQEKHH